MTSVHTRMRNHDVPYVNRSLIPNSILLFWGALVTHTYIHT
jgi:hypothetical protein